MADFGDALKAMKAGKQVRRAYWTSRVEDDGWMALRDPGPPFEPQMVLKYPGNPVLRPFGGSQFDLLAEDWEIEG